MNLCSLPLGKLLFCCFEDSLMREFHLSVLEFHLSVCEFLHTFLEFPLSPFEFSYTSVKTYVENLIAQKHSPSECFL